VDNFLCLYCLSTDILIIYNCNVNNRYHFVDNFINITYAHFVDKYVDKYVHPDLSTRCL